MEKIYYVVEYGTSFYHKSKKFDTEREARQFIAEHVFADSRSFSFKKVEELQADVDFRDWNHPDFKDRKDVQAELFDHGIF